MSRGWLIVFAKAPREGLVKTRMSPPLSLAQAATLYDAMLSDVLEASAGFALALDLEPVLAFHPPDAVGEMLTRTPPAFRLQVQRGLGLGERMANAFAEAGAAGARIALLRGSDSPALDFARIEAMTLRLEAGCDAVFTPDTGGGYAMVGQRGAESRLFDVSMSTNDMLRRTLDLASSLGLRVDSTEPVDDLDAAVDLASLTKLSAAESSDLCPRTVEAIGELRRIGVL